MNSISNTWKQAIWRAVIVSGFVIVIGFIIFHSSIFISTNPTFQFVVTGVTIGISYAAFKSGTPKYAILPLFVWYLFLVGKQALENTWILILSSSYILAIAGAIYLYLFIASKSFINGRIQRIVALTLVVGIINGLIIIFLGLFRIKEAIANPIWILTTMYSNLQIGTVIGIISGLGIELVEYVLKRESH